MEKDCKIMILRKWKRREPHEEQNTGKREENVNTKTEKTADSVKEEKRRDKENC